MRGGSNGIASITRLLRIMDDDGDKRLSRSELKYVQLFILFLYRPHILLLIDFISFEFRFLFYFYFLL